MFTQNHNVQNRWKRHKIAPVRAIVNSHETAQFMFNIRDQRSFRCGFTRARRGWKKQNAVALCFRQRHGGGRYVPASFPPSLRLHFTFPPAEPLTEACRWRT